MDRTRIATAVAGVLTLAIALFAIGTAVTSDGDEVDPAARAPDGTESSADQEVASGEVEIEIVDFTFGPQEPVVEVGTEVTWINQDGTDHFILPSGDSFDTSPNLEQGDTWSFVFTEPGTFDYICGNHPATMAGSITVVEG